MASQPHLRVHPTGTMDLNPTELREIGLQAGMIVQPVQSYDIHERIKRWNLTKSQHQMIVQAYSKVLSHQATAQELVRFKEEYIKQYGSFSCPTNTIWICLEKNHRGSWHETAAMRD